MILHGEGFLRSLFKSGDPVRKTANAAQQRRVANILKGIEGLGCWIDKPLVDEGRNWRIVVDGRSDVPIPPGVKPPWARSVFEAYSNSTYTSTSWVLQKVETVQHEDLPFVKYIPAPPYDCYGVVVSEQMNGMKLRLTARVQYWDILTLTTDNYEIKASFAVSYGDPPPYGSFALLDGDVRETVASIGVAKDLSGTIVVENESAHTHTVSSIPEVTTGGTAHAHDLDMEGWRGIYETSVTMHRTWTVGSAPLALGVMIRHTVAGGGGYAVVRFTVETM
jgi:hypothetical protein